MSSAPKSGKNTTRTSGAFGGVGNPESTQPSANPNPNPSGVGHSPRPERTAPKAGGDGSTPPSVKSNIVDPVSAPKDADYTRPTSMRSNVAGTHAKTGVTKIKE